MLSPLRLPSSWGLLGPATHVLWAPVCGYGVQRCPRGPYFLCSSGACSRGFAARVSVVRGVCGQALPLPRLSALWAGCRDPSSTLAVGARRCPLGLHALPCGGRAPRGWRGPSPGGWPASVARGVWCQALSLPRSPALWAGRQGSVTHMLWARACGCGGPALSHRPACPLGAACRGGGGGPPPGGEACQRCEGRLVSDAVPLPASGAGSRGRPVSPRCGRCGRGDPAPAPQRAPLRAGVARRGAGGRASPGGSLPLFLRGV